MKLPYIPGIVCKIVGHRWREEKPAQFISAGRPWRWCTGCQIPVQFREGGRWVDREEFLKTWKGDYK